jgi:CrcB protein
MYAIISIAAGGALGALMRHAVNTGMAHWLGMNFPWGTLVVNVLGSFAMGILISVFAHFWQPPQEIKLLLITGFLGAFTTFSTFSLDFSVLYEGGRLEDAFIYMAASVIVSIAALFFGLHLVRVMV